jgi:excisionase family DNA binding protein
MPRFAQVFQPLNLRNLASPNTSGTPETPGAWLALGPAARLLGVNESTLRRWADEGNVPFSRTPGGHRRFAEVDLRRLRSAPSDDLAASHEYKSLGSLAVSRIRRRLQQGKRHPAAWYSTVDEASRMRLRPLGRRLVALATDCLERRLRGNRLMDEARAIGREYGFELANGGLALRDAMEAFTFFRHSLDESAQQIAQHANLSVEEAASAWEQVVGLADLVLIEMVDAFETQRVREVP